MKLKCSEFFLPVGRLRRARQGRRQRLRRGKWWWDQPVARLPACPGLPAKMEGFLITAEKRGEIERQKNWHPSRSSRLTSVTGDGDQEEHSETEEAFSVQFQAENDPQLRGGGG